MGPRKAPSLAVVILSALWLASPTPAHAWFDTSADEIPPRARGIHVMDGSYVMSVGQLQVNVTNWGLIGSRHTTVTSYADAPSGQWPAGSGIEYLWAAGLWVGAKVNQTPAVSTGQPQAELRPLSDLASTIYEARQARIVRPPDNPLASGLRPPSAGADDDGDGRTDEERIDGHDNDGDGKIDEDFAQIGDQMMFCSMVDDTPLSREMYPDHSPLGITVEQESYAWTAPDYDDFVAFRFVIRNHSQVELTDVYLGFYVDCDVGLRGSLAGSDDYAGFWQGRTQASDGTYAGFSVAYMADGAARNRVPGYFGAMILGSGVLGYHRFTGTQPFENGGEPVSDADRYHLLTRRVRDPDVTEPGQEGDHRFLLTTGPIPVIRPHGATSLVVILVAGNGLEGLLTNCANAWRCWYGEFFDLDANRWTGVGGRETYTCEEWWPWDPIARMSSLFKHDARYMDDSCLSPNISFSFIEPKDLDQDALGNHCLWVNMDNCEECAYQMGQPCTQGNGLMEKWNCWNERLPAIARPGCTGILGRESRIRWYVGRNAPPAPDLRVVPDERAVHVFWNDRSEHTPDLISDLIDFESYLIWRADDWDRPFGTSTATGPAAESWRVIAQYDLDNTYWQDIRYSGGVRSQELPLGPNTGLEPVLYRPVCLDDGRFAGLAESMQQVVDADTLGAFSVRPPLRQGDGTPLPGLEGLLRWEGYPDVLDTFFLVAARPEDPERGVPGKRPVRFYEYVDREVHDGYLYFYSVTASDHLLDYVDDTVRITGPGLVGTPSTSFTSAMPGSRSQTAEERRRLGPNIYVYPNPATRQSLAEFQQMHPNEGDPTGVRVVFANLPRAHNRVRVFTVDGDLVADLQHDGTGGEGHLPWNLVSRSGQEVVSGIYLYSVESDDDAFADFIGRFVVIR